MDIEAQLNSRALALIGANQPHALMFRHSAVYAAKLTCVRRAGCSWQRTSIPSCTFPEHLKTEVHHHHRHETNYLQHCTGALILKL